MEKTKLELLTICDYASISQDNKLSIIGIFEQIYVQKLPSQHPQMFIVGILKGQSGKKDDLTLSITTPTGKDTIPNQTIPFSIGPNGKSNLIAGIGNMPIPEAGFYKVLLSVAGRKIGEKEFGVFPSPPPVTPANNGQKYKN